MSTIDTINDCSAPKTADVTRERPVADLLVRLMYAVVRSGGKRRSRRALLALNDEQLKDIGISRADAYREGTRPFWR